jgi:hypothetical protein
LLTENEGVSERTKCQHPAGMNRHSPALTMHSVYAAAAKKPGNCLSNAASASKSAAASVIADDDDVDDDDVDDDDGSDEDEDEDEDKDADSCACSSLPSRRMTAVMSTRDVLCSM